MLHQSNSQSFAAVDKAAEPEKKMPRMFRMAATPSWPTSAESKDTQAADKSAIESTPKTSGKKALPSFWANLPTPNRNRALKEQAPTAPSADETKPIVKKEEERTAGSEPSGKKQLPSCLANLPTPNRNRILKEQAPKKPTADETKPSKKKAEKKVAGSEELPPVVYVHKMASKGCAIVILRDQVVMDLAVAMKVAVVDGICCEVRRHTPDKENEEKQPLGVFCAWGFRVERRMPVSEEGLAAYFNGLSKVAEPAGLKPEAPFAETFQHFELSSEGPLTMDTKPQTEIANTSQMLDGPHGRPDLVKNIWDAKKNMEDLWQRPPPPMGRSLMQRVAREQLFPHSGKEGVEHENRAGEKLEELATAVGLLEDVPKNSAFLDLCGGPGSWSQFLLDKPELAMKGFGFTLRSNTGETGDWKSQEKDDWYPDLVQSNKWTALWGEDGTGDLLKPKNLEHCTQHLRDQGGVFLCVADGGFNDKAIPPNLLELYFYRLFLAELLTAVSCLQPGGRFVCKMYTSCSAATSSLLFLTTRLFEKSTIVKPKTSRVAGPERYLYCSGFLEGAETTEIRAALSQSQFFGAGASPLQTPLLTPIVSSIEISKDSQFLEQLKTMVACLCERQAGAVQAIVDRAIYLEDIALDAADKSAAKAKYWEAAAAVQFELHEAGRAVERAAKAEAREAEREAENIRPVQITKLEKAPAALKGSLTQQVSLRPQMSLRPQKSLRPQTGDSTVDKKVSLSGW